MRYFEHKNLKPTIRSLLLLSFTAGAIHGGTALAASPPTLPDLLRWVEADPLAVVYVEKLGEVLDSDIAHVVAWGPRADHIRKVLEQAGSLFDGPMALAVHGTPLRPDRFQLKIATSVTADRRSFIEKLNKDIIPELNMLTVDGSGLGVSLVDDGDILTITAFGTPMPPLYLAFRDGLLYVSTNRGAIRSDRSGAESDSGIPSFVESEDYDRLLRTRTKDARALLYVNMRTLAPLAGIPLNRELPGLSRWLGIDRIEAVAASLTTDADRLSVNVTAALRKDDQRAMGLLMEATGAGGSLSCVPDQFPIVFSMAITSGADLMDRANELIALVDPRIVQEFQEEAAEFQRDFGFDPQKDFQGNNVGDVTLAIEPVISDGDVRSLNWAMIVGLKDVQEFERHVATMARAFRLDLTIRRDDQATYYMAPEDGPRFAFAVHKNRLLLARDPQTLRRFVDAAASNSTIDRQRAYVQTMSSIAPGSTLLAYADLARLFASLEPKLSEAETHDPEAAIMRDLMQLVKAAGLTVALKPQTLEVRMALSATEPGRGGTMLAEAVSRSIQQSRIQTERVVSMANMRGILMACSIYSNDHKGVFPASLDEIRAGGMITEFLLQNPYSVDERGNIGTTSSHSFYIYRRPSPEQASVPNFAILAECQASKSGAAIGFLDGHVEWVPMPEAQRLINEIARGR